jgi:RND family efflux transporter MFP subunit
VVEVLAEEGDEVVAGQALARLDQRDAQAQLEDARIALQEAKDAAAKSEITRRDAESMIEKSRLAYEQAKRDYERNQKARMISALEIEKLKLAMDTADQDQKTAVLAKDRAVIDERTMTTAIARAQLSVDRAQVALSNTEMRAPFGGVISRRDVQVGDNVGPSVQAFTVTDLSNLRTVFYRPQRELALFAGTKHSSPDDAPQVPGYEAIEVTATSEALPGHTFTGRIERISPNIDATSGSFRVTVRLDPESDGLRLLPGMLLRLRLVTERHQGAITVSKRALRREGEATILFVAEEGHVRRVEVVEGFSGDEYIEVTPRAGAALEPGMLIVVVGNRDLEDGKEIEISPWDDELVEDGAAGVSESPVSESPVSEAPESESESEESGGDE